MFNPRQLVDFYFLGRHRLETVALLPLGRSVSEAVEIYGSPLETGPSEETAEITQHTFSVGRYHQAIAFEWKGTIQSITYRSAKSDPARDLRYVLDCYEDGSKWRVMEEGYLFHREDGRVRLWCSVFPAIGVAYVEFLAAKAKYATANRLRQLNGLSDATWAANDAVFELQRQFVQDKNAGLMEFASRSGRIAASPDGRHVFIVRNHHAFNSENGFREFNEPPQKGNGYSTQVINCFTWSETGSMWGKIVLPTDATVESIRFDGVQCHLRISQSVTNRVLTFSGPAASVLRLEGTTCCAGAYDNNRLWKALSEEAERSAGADGPPPVAQP
jgi:hypothetical protein